MDVATVAVVVGAALAASVAQSVAAFGFGLIVVPVLLLVLDVHDTVVISSVLGLANVVLLALRVWKDVPWRTVVWLLAGSFAGMPGGIAILVFTPQDALRLAVALAAVVMAAGLAMGVTFRTGRAASELAAGLASGVLRTSTSMSGPPVVIYLHGSGRSMAEIRGALTMYFLVTSVASIAAFLAAGVVSTEALAMTGIALPAVYAGSWAGNRLLDRVDATLFARLVLVLLTATALSAAGSAIERLIR